MGVFHKAKIEIKVSLNRPLNSCIHIRYLITSILVFVQWVISCKLNRNVAHLNDKTRRNVSVTSSVWLHEHCLITLNWDATIITEFSNFFNVKSQYLKPKIVPIFVYFFQVKLTKRNASFLKARKWFGFQNPR